ncbi:hypothetical protein HYDPIDRAFT_23752 [Hydnomerulius pinastri MD-312]|nr:hypothetical protein HYDPIDRAFT_23752 [Hydnomerulius pinastri MD-312]
MSSMEAVEGSAVPTRQPSTRDVLNSLQEQITLMQQTINKQAAQLKDQTPVINIKKKFNKKVEVIADPGQYTGDKARFAKWWTKMRTGLRANADTLSNNFELCTAVWSQLSGPIVGWVFLLKTNASPHIIKQIFLLGARATTIEEYIELIQRVGQAQESFLMFQPAAKTQGHA